MAVPTRRERRFTVRLQPTEAGDDWGFTLNELNGTESVTVAALPAHRAGPHRRALIEAVVADGYRAAAVSPRRKRPFNLTQEPGVRLALMVRASDPVRKADRRWAISERVRAMGSEEALYWYAHIAGGSGGRALRALRVLLAAE